jgi:soluble lytic murein transglycosylase-like protein
MYFNIEKYAEKYRIPKRFAYGIAYAETRYEGPFHWKYRSAQTSHAGAVGPMQIMPTTADMMWPKTKVSRDRLKTDIAFNVETSMKLLRRLHDRYGDWKIVFGCYNTGRPMINGYSEMVYNHQPKWNTD